jgi:hypothetical protein
LPTLQRLLAAAGFELRLHLTPLDPHDETLAAYLASLPAKTQAELETRGRQRAAAARLRRVRGS